MQVLTQRLDVAGFLAHVPQAGERCLMLDYDGTLAPFQVRPELAVPYPEVRPVLEDIVRCGATRLIIVSGRPADEVPPLLALSAQPEIWGAHGRERLMPDGRRFVHTPDREVLDALHAAEAALRAVMPPGARLEKKLASLALHWRGLPEDVADQLALDAARVWEPHVRGAALELLSFDGGLELRAAGWNKQHAVEAILTEVADDAAVAYLGDDLTDEDAFRAVRPRGLAVLVRPQLRDTAADLWLEPPADLVAFLAHWSAKRR